MYKCIYNICLFIHLYYIPGFDLTTRDSYLTILVEVFTSLIEQNTRLQP